MWAGLFPCRRTWVSRTDLWSLEAVWDMRRWYSVLLLEAWWNPWGPHVESLSLFQSLCLVSLRPMQNQFPLPWPLLPLQRTKWYPHFLTHGGNTLAFVISCYDPSNHRMEKLEDGAVNVNLVPGTVRWGPCGIGNKVWDHNLMVCQPIFSSQVEC